MAIPLDLVNTETVSPERERRPRCECPECLYAACAPPDEEGEARQWVLHDAAMCRDEDDALELLAELERLDDWLDHVEREAGTS